MRRDEVVNDRQGRLIALPVELLYFADLNAGQVNRNVLRVQKMGEPLRYGLMNCKTVVTVIPYLLFKLSLTDSRFGRACKQVTIR